MPFTKLAVLWTTMQTDPRDECSYQEQDPGSEHMAERSFNPKTLFQVKN